jgi:serine/threonine protein kinase
MFQDRSMPLEKKPQSEPIRGYRLLEPLGSGGFGEVWKCEAPGGIFKAIKFVYGNLNGLDNDSVRAEEELRAVQRIKSIRHPFLLSMDRVENVAGELIIVTELADHNLDEVLQKHRAQGRPGIPRGELLTYLREAAEVLDLMNLKFDLQHLDIKPRNLFLVSNHVKVADFGLVNSLAGAKNAELQLGAITPLYAAPELFIGKLSRHCDQYSLAIVFQELLTGTLPFMGTNSRQLLMQHTQSEPDLAALPAADRPLIARALAKNPDHRFPSCMDLIRTLLGENVSADPTAVRTTSSEAQATQPMTETVSELGPIADKHPQRRPALPAEVLTDHLFLEPLGNSPLFDLWKVQTPSGKQRLAKFLYGLGKPMPKLQENIASLRSLHHPALVPCEIVHLEPGRLVLVTDLIKETLRDRFVQCQGQKLPGIPRGELIDYIRAAAEVLDYMYQQHGVQHLGLNPRCLILDNGWLQITDFGQAQLLWAPAGHDIAQRNARYAAPELFDKKITRSSDQVSLALLYVEMLSGVHPDRQNKPPDLANLPPLDREVISRALQPDPADRWPSCTDMVLALEGTPPEVDKELRAKPDRFTSLLQMPPPGRPLPVSAAIYGDLHQIIADIIAAAGGEVAAENLEEIPQLSADGMVLAHKFQAGLPLGSAKEKLDEFANLCFGRRVRDDESGCLFFVPLTLSFWDKWLNRHAGLEIDIRLGRVNPSSATPIDVAATVRIVHCNNKKSRHLLEQLGPEILENLRKLLLVNSNKRTQARLLWPHKIKVIPLLSNGERDHPVECRGKDISHSGLGFYLPEELDTAEVLIELNNPVHQGVVIPATLVRAKRCADGWYDVGALFRLPAIRKSTHDFCLDLPSARSS